MNAFKEVGLVLDPHNLEKAKRPITRIVVHCTATPQGRYHTAKDIHKWHQESGWLGIGYHYVLTVSGELQQGRDIEEKGAHARGYNYGSLAVVLVGGTDNKLIAMEKGFTQDQLLYLEVLLKELIKLYPDAEIVGHRELPGVNKACPCLKVSDYYHKG